jgi:uncharacterized caspase-like protein
MMDKKTMHAELTAIDKTLTELEEQLERGYIDLGRYTRLKADWERKRAALEAQLPDSSTSSAKNPTSKPSHPPRQPIKSPGMDKAFTRGHALLIGVGDYVNPRFADLPVTMQDAQTLADVLTNPSRAGHQPDHVRTITGSDATAVHIRAALQTLAQSTNPQSTAFIYFSGHGGRVLENGQWHTYLCPREADPDDLPNTAISGDEFSAALSAIPARRVLVVLDACHAGGSAELKAANGTLKWKSGLPEDYYEALSQGSGRVVIASSKAAQYSRVRPQGDLSLFTYHLREALNGKAAVRGDGLIHVLDVFHYVNEAVQADDPEQTPILKVNDLDLNFPIAVAPAEVSEAPKASKAASEVEDIREQIVRDPVAGARALSEYLENHPDLAAKRNEVDLKRSQLEDIQHDLELFGPDPAKKAEKSRTVFYLLRVCLELEDH